MTAKEAAWGIHKHTNFCEHINRTILLMLWSSTSQKEQTLSSLHSGLHLCYLCHANHKSKQAHKLAHYCFKAVCQYCFKGVTTAKSSIKHHQLFMKKKKNLKRFLCTEPTELWLNSSQSMRKLLVMEVSAMWMFCATAPSPQHSHSPHASASERHCQSACMPETSRSRSPLVRNISI